MVENDRAWLTNGGSPRVIEGFPVERGRRWEHPSRRTFLHSLDADERRAVTAVGDEVTYAPRQRVYARQDLDLDTHVIVIRSGWTKVSVNDNGCERILAFRGPGEIVGERAAINSGGRSADVTALDEVRALMIPGDRFRTLIAEHPRIGEVLQRQEAERRIEDDRPGSPEADDVERRLAGLLLELALHRGGHQHDGAVTIDLPLLPQDLAHWVDQDSHDIELVLHAWQRRGVVRTPRGHLVVADAAALERIVDATGRSVPRRALDSPPDAPLNHSILYTDIAGFGDPRRSDGDRREVHTALYRILHDSLLSSGVRWDSCLHEDRGDGTLTVAPPMIAPTRLVEPFLAHLAAGLRRHNRRYQTQCQIQLRVALHMGPVAYGPQGLSGQALIDAARMLDAPALKRALAESGADLGFITSAHVYDTVIRHRDEFIDAEAFTPVDVAVKEAQFRGWMYLAGVGVRV